MRIALVLIAGLAGAAYAAQPAPEIVRPTGTPQATGAVHGVRTIPEACARLEGVFTGEPGQPYRVAARRTAPNCRSRARLVDTGAMPPSAGTGWVLNDVIRIPSADCPGLQATVRVWRKPAVIARPPQDAQGQTRIYLHDALVDKREAQPAPMLFAAEVAVAGRPCR